MSAKSKKVYRAELKRFMAFLGREGELDTTFSPNQLLGVMPNDVARYRTYGRSTPVSVVLRAIRKDKASGGHPNLR
jgi:hypothetical protein